MSFKKIKSLLIAIRDFKVNKDVNSKTTGISGYAVGNDSILIKYTNGGVYTYSVSEDITRQNLVEMVALAKAGSGLNTYINKNPKIKNGYTAVNTSISVPLTTYQ